MKVWILKGQNNSGEEREKVHKVFSFRPKNKDAQKAILEQTKSHITEAEHLEEYETEQFLKPEEYFEYYQDSDEDIWLEEYEVVGEKE